MWKAGVDTKMNLGGGDDDDWETDPDFVVSAIIQVLCVHFLCSPLQVSNINFDFYVRSPPSVLHSLQTVDVLDLTLRYRFNHDFSSFSLKPDIYSLRRLSL